MRKRVREEKEKGEGETEGEGEREREKEPSLGRLWGATCSGCSATLAPWEGELRIELCSDSCVSWDSQVTLGSQLGLFAFS